MSQEYELINYSEHGSVVDGVLYSCDFSDKNPLSFSSVHLTVDDITALGSGRRAQKAKERLNIARKSLEDKHEAKRALEAALKLAVPASILDESFLAEEMSKAEGLVTRMGLKRVAAETSVVSIPLAKTRKIDPAVEQKTITSKPSAGAQDKLKTNATLATQARNSNKKTSNPNSQMKKNSVNCHRAPPVKDSAHTHQIKRETKTAFLPVRQTLGTKEAECSTTLSKEPQPLVPCMCKRSASSVVGSNGRGWEGTATLYHGSKLRFGCIQFVLSLAGRPGHAELVEGLSKVANSTLTILNNCDQSKLTN